MILHLVEMPGTYLAPADGQDGAVYCGKLPLRMRYLYPEAARSLADIENTTGGLIYTDMFRTAAASLVAYRSKTGTQRPGYSAHGYGIAIDIDIARTLRRLRTDYPSLRQMLQENGWYCHRRDGAAQQPEAWHFNWLGPRCAEFYAAAELVNHATWALPAEQMIQDLYGPQLRLTVGDTQTYLAALKFYDGPSSGRLDSFTVEAVREFQVAWGLAADGVPGPQTQRTLAYVTAHLEVMPWQLLALN